MTEEVQNNANQEQPKTDNKELNFARQRQMYERQLAEKEAKIRELEQLKQSQQSSSIEEEDDDGEPYVDRRKLNKTLNKFGQNTQSEIQKAMELARQQAKEELKQEIWMDTNKDFYDVLTEDNAMKLATRHPDLAKTIERMPNGFEKQKLVYQTIKELGLHKPEVKQPSIQDKIDANRRSPYYQPSGIGNPPPNAMGDFSNSGQQNAYKKMKELQSKLRLG